jgi:hypothetical protein
MAGLTLAPPGLFWKSANGTARGRDAGPGVPNL